MFDNNVFLENTCVNVRENEQIIGYEMQTNITYYRGIPLSMIEYIRVSTDGEEVPEEDIRISIDCNDWFTLKEAETVTTYKWEYGDPLYVRVLQEGGLSEGIHKIKLTVATRTAYIPVPLEGVKEREIMIDWEEH